MMAIASANVRKYCPHCDEQVALSTYKFHRRLFYDKKTKLWISSHTHVNENSSESDMESPPPPELFTVMENQDDDSPPDSTFDLLDEDNVDDTEPDVEVWDEDEDDIIADLPEDDPPNLADENVQVDVVPRRSRVLAVWVLRFLMIMQAVFKLSDIVLGHFLKFIVVFFELVGGVGREIAQCLPASVYKAKKMIGEMKFQRFVVCRKCYTIYSFRQCIEGSGAHQKSKCCSFRRFPNHRFAYMRASCGIPLLKTVELASKKVVFYPYLMYCYLSVEVSLQSLFERPSFYHKCEHWRTRSTINEELRDVYDGSIWHELSDVDGEPFLSEPGNLGLIMNFDFFQPYDHVQYSLGAIYMSVLNLPREERYKQENTILVGLIPGPTEPDNLNSFIKPLVDDLLKFWNGIQFSVASLSCVKKIRGALVCVACDLPAGRKICGFLSHAARLGCSRCYKKFPGEFGALDYSGFDRHNWHLRSRLDHNAAAFDLRNKTSLADLERAESSSGCRYSELLLLPYFDAPRMLIIDPMHNLFLGTAKHFFKKILVDRGLISDVHLSMIQNRVSSCIIPAGIGRIPQKIKSGFAEFTADQWKNWVIYFSIISMRDIIVDEVLECWRHFVLACRTLCCKHITRDDAKLGDALLLQFCRRTEQLFGKESITPNMHMHCHLYDCIKDFGPLHGFWCYAFERYNGILGSIPNNNRCIEGQLMSRFLRENQILSSIPPSDFSEQLLPVFPKAKCTGSLADTCAVESIEPTCEQNWTLQSLLSTVQLPKYSTRCVLDPMQRECITKLYSRLYSVPLSNIDIATTCVRYTSVVVKGHQLGVHKSRFCSSSIVFAKWDSNIFDSHCVSNVRAARIDNFYKHTVTINGNSKNHLLVSLSWHKFHPKCLDFGKPVTVWYFDLFEYYDIYSLVPVQFIVSRAIGLIDKLDGESVLFTVPCLDF